MSRTVTLEFGCFGRPENPPLVIIHGLMGSSRNWMGVGKMLSEYFDVFALDLRNHGNSPHAETMSYEELVADLEHWVERKALGNFYLMGHSLGGKVSMAYAARHGDRLKGLIVEDIAPKDYDPRYTLEFKLLNELNLEALKSRDEADKFLESGGLKDYAWRQFLLTNLGRDKTTKQFKWTVNIKALTAGLPGIMKDSMRPGEKFAGPTLFIRGAASDFIQDDDYTVIKERFPRHAVVKISNAGHNVHVDNPEELIQALIKFKQHIER